MIKTLIVDDHPIVREGLRQIVGKTSNIVVADEASNAMEMLDKIQSKDYDVILLDITMPGANGLDILKQALKIKPKLHVLLLSIHPEEEYAIRGFKAGAYGYLTKGSAPVELVDAIQKVSLGKKYVSPSLAEKLAFTLGGNTEHPLHETLSDREYSVMCMIALGRTTRQIAADLSLSVKTVNTYRYRVMRKMNMSSNAELIRYAIQNNLVP